MAAALQELATNAIKYGSLSIPMGALDVHWTSEGQTIRLEWIESGGPAVSIPSRRGFGSKLIQELLAKDTGWEVDMRYCEKGLQCHITMYDGVSAPVSLRNTR